MIQEYCNRNRDASLSTAPESSSTFCCPCSTSHLVRKDTIQNNKSDIESESEIKKHSDLVRKDTIQNNKSKIESESEIKKQSETTTASQGECQCHKRRKTTLPSTEQTHIDERRAAEATSDIHASKIPEQQARVLNAIQILRLELKLKLPAGWDDSALALLVRMYDETCGQRSQMSALHKELGVKTGRHERSIQRLLQNLRKLFGSAEARLVSDFFDLAESWTEEQDATLIQEYERNKGRDITIPGRTKNQISRRIRALHKSEKLQRKKRKHADAAEEISKAARPSSSGGLPNDKSSLQSEFRALTQKYPLVAKHAKIIGMNIGKLPSSRSSVEVTIVLSM